MTYDFSGYATKHNIRCSDGRVIMPDAFKECDGTIVPLVWQHMHDSPDNVLGHAELENRPDGVYAYCSFNDTKNGENAKSLVKHGDICALSIYANRLEQAGRNVMHGVIREVSLVLAGANPGATIDNLAFAHSDGSKEIIEDEACISFVDESYKIIMHSDDEDEEAEDSEETIGDIIDSMTEKQRQAVYALIGSLVEDEETGSKKDSEDEESKDEESDEKSLKHADDESEDEGEGSDETVQDVLDTLSAEQKKALDAILAVISGESDSVDDEVKKQFDTFSEKQKNAVYALVGLAAEESDKKSLKHADDESEDDEEDSDETIQDVLDTLSAEQKKALDAILAVLSGESDSVDDEVKKQFDTFSEKQKNAVYALVGLAAEESGDESMKHADDPEIEEIINGMDDQQLSAIEAILDAVENGEEDVPAEVKTIVDQMSDEQKEAVKALIESASDESDDSEDDEENQNDEEIKHYAFKGDMMAKHNIFESQMSDGVTLSHDDMKAVFDDAPRFGSLKEAALQHGITDIEVLFPEAQAVNNQPYQVSRRMEWVSTVLNGVHKSPFSRIKSTAVNLTEEQARAKGYVKGRKKIEEQISALRRVTTPQTVYKLQKLDRDDILDITDFDVVAFMKQEMRMMLDEEIARAILVGDGRVGTDPEKIFPDHVRPVWSDDEMYTIHRVVPAAKATDYEYIMDEFVRARKDYKGSGNPVAFIGSDMFTEMRLLKDQDGRARYESDEKLAQVLRVSKVEEVEFFDELTRTVEGKDRKIVAVVLNLADYTVGADKGGEVTMFDDFDIDFNKMSYLIETRMSGALTMPKSAIAIEIQTATDSTPEVRYVKVTSPVTADIADYYEQDEYGRYIKTVDVAVITGKTYFEIEE